MNNWVIIDFETTSSCDLKKAGAWRYAEDPTTDVLCLCWEWRDLVSGVWLPGTPTARMLEWVSDPETVVIAHNVGFEKAIWRQHVMPLYGLPDIPDERWHDTMAVCAMKTLPQKLEDAAKALRLNVEKDLTGSRLVIGLSKFKKGYAPAVTPGLLERVVQYCQTDVAVEAALHRRLSWLPPGERRIWLLDQKINARGVALDLAFVAAAQKVVADATRPLAKEFEDLTGGLSFTQGMKLKAWLKDRGVELPNLTKETIAALGIGADEDEDDDEPSDDWENYVAATPLPDDVRRALTIRSLIGSASVKKLKAMGRSVGADGRVHYTLRYYGAGTGRWTALLLQLHNFPRGTLNANDPEVLVNAIMTGDAGYIETVIGPPVEAVISGLRHAIVAAPGHKLVVGDFAQIEARIVLALAGQTDKVELLASGGPVYEDMAEAIFGHAVNKKDNPEERQLGKNTVLGCGFGMGHAKFRDRYARDKSEDFCKSIIDTYRKEWAPEVPKLWYALERAALDTMRDRTPHTAYGITYTLDGAWLTALLPSGRALYYYEPKLDRKAMPWDKTDIRECWSYSARKNGKWVRVYAYGGHLTENVVQALARDLMVSAMLACEAAGLPIVLTVHDEIVLEVPEAQADAGLLKRLMEDAPPWARDLGIPVAAETWTGERYKK